MNYLFLDNGFEEIEAITTIDLLRRANIAVTTVSITGNPMVLGAHNIAVEADGLIERIDFSDAEMLILPGGQTKLGECSALCDLLIEHNKADKLIAAIWVLSRGYKRKGKGFRLVTVEDTADLAGDEPLQIKRKFPDVLVAVDKDRNHGVEQLLALPEELRPQMVLLDDGFQHRRLKPALNLVLVDYNRPIFKDNLLPVGRLRDLPEQIRRADVVVMTKSPRYLDEWERGKMRQLTRLRPSQPLFFATLKYGELLPVFRWEADKRYIYSKDVFLFSGVADDRPLRVHLTDRYEHIAHKRFSDHHRFTHRDLRRLAQEVRRNPRALLLTTEKDAQRLLHCEKLDPEVRRRLFYLPVETEFLTWEEGEAFDELMCRNVPEKEPGSLLF